MGVFLHGTVGLQHADRPFTKRLLRPSADLHDGRKHERPLRCAVLESVDQPVFKTPHDGRD